MRSKTRKSKQKGGEDFSRQDLTGRDFSDQDLARSNFSGATLTGANFTRAILINADLTNAKLNSADLIDADLTEAHLTGADLTDAGLIGAKLLNAKLNNADLTKATLHKADFSKAFLKRARFRKAILTGANLTDADLTFADLTDANLTGANLIDADLTEAHLTGAVLTEAVLVGAKLLNVKLNSADLTNADLNGANLTGADLTGANLTGADLFYAYLTLADLTGANLTGADLTDADLTGADLTDANLTDANLTDADLTGADLTDANLTDANLTDANLTGADLTDANFTGAQNNQQRNESNIIKVSIPKKVLNGNQNKKEKCKSYEKLFNLINELNLDIKPIFYFEGQTGIDAGGLTRIVFDKYLQEFKRHFFVKKENSDLLKFILSTNNSKKTLFYLSLEKLKKLRDYSSTPNKQVKIFIKIDPFLLDILQSDNPKSFFTKANVNKYLKSKGINKTNPNIIKAYNEKAVFGNQLLQNNINENKRIKDWRTNFTNNEVQDILLRFFLQLEGFISMEQFKFMQKFIQENWKENFTNYIDYSLSAFSKRIIINFNQNDEEFNPNKNYNNMYSQNNNVKPFIDYIKESDENRIKFTELVTGTKFYDGLIKIFVFNSESYDKKPYVAHTCFQNIDIYPTPKINKNGLVVQINTDLESPELNK